MRIGRTIVIGGIVCMGLAAAQPRNPIFLNHANSLAVSEINGVTVQELKGNVKMTKDSMTVTCQNALYYPDSGRAIFRTDVEFRDPSRVLFADQVVYNDFTEELEASSRVRIYQHDTLSVTSRRARFLERLGIGYLYDDVRVREQNRRVQLIGQLGYIDHNRQYVRITGKPVMTEMDSVFNIITEVRGDTVEYFGDEKRVRVSGKVQILRDSLVASGTLLDYYTKDRTAILIGDPEAIRDENHITGDTMRLFFEEERLSKVEIVGNAVATSPADSGFAEPRNRMEGKRMTLWVDQSVLTRADIEGTAIASYFVREKGEKRGMNVTSGDRLIVFFEDRRISRIRVEGGTQGAYTPQSLVKEEPADGPKP